MKSILTSVYCISCVWSILAGLGIFGLASYYKKKWLPLYGPTPNEGEVEGFTSVEARTAFYKEKAEALRVRKVTIVVVVGIVVWFVGLFIAWLILK